MRTICPELTVKIAYQCIFLFLYLPVALFVLVRLYREGEIERAEE